MSGTVTFVVGLAGSGKSWFIDNMLDAYRAWHDGFMAAGQHEKHHRELIWLLRHGYKCAISEPQLMGRYVRAGYVQRLRRAVPSVRVRWIYFENNLKAANRNCQLRKNKPGDPGGKDHVRMNNGWSPYYDVPSLVMTRRIHRMRVAK